MTLRIATWNIQDEGKLSPEHLLELLLNPGHNPLTSVGTTKLNPIDIIVLQEVPLSSKYSERLKDAIKAARKIDPSLRKYKVSDVAHSITRGDQLQFEVELKDRNAATSTIGPIKGSPNGDDGYMVVYDADKLTLIDPKMPLADGSHHTLRYSTPTLRDAFRNDFVKEVKDANGVLVSATLVASPHKIATFFNRRPWYLRLQWGADRVHIYTWHAPPDKEAFPTLEMFLNDGYEKVGSLTDFNKSNDALLIMGDLNVEKKNLPDFFKMPSGHVHKKFDHIIVAQKYDLKQVTGVVNVVHSSPKVRDNYSDHPLLVADLSKIASASSKIASASSKIASASQSTASTSSTSTAATSSSSTTSSPASTSSAPAATAATTATTASLAPRTSAKRSRSPVTSSSKKSHT